MNKVNQLSDYLFLREGTTYVRIPLSRIEYIQADGNYAYIQTDDKRFAVKRSLASISEELKAPDFLRASRGILVNFTRVNTISFANGVINVGNYEVKMGKAYHAEIKNLMPRL